MRCLTLLALLAVVPAQTLTRVHDAEPFDLVEVHGELYFSAKRLPGVGPQFLHRIDRDGVKTRSQFVSKRPILAGSKLFFSNRRYQVKPLGSILHVSDLRTGVIRMLLLDTGTWYQAADPQLLFAWRGLAFFHARRPNGVGLFVSDGTPVGTRLLNSALGSGFCGYRDRLFYWAKGGLWSTDGTPAGTRLTVGMPVGLWGHSLTVVGDRLLFLAGDRVGSTNGTVKGTRLLKGYHRTSSGRYLVHPMVAFGGQAYFIQGPKGGEELYRTDGKTFSLVKDIWPGANGSTPAFLMPFGDRLLFAADDGVAGREPWISDGTAKGTRRLADLWPGKTSSLPFNFKRVSDRLAVFAAGGLDANGKPTGFELYVTDGTTKGTRLMANLAPGKNSTPRDFTMVGGKVYFATRLGLYAVDIGATSHVVSSGCTAHGRPRLDSTDPILGRTLRISVRGTASSNGVLGLARRAGIDNVVDLGAGCQLLLDQDSWVLPVPFRTSAAGSWQWSFAAPRSPGLQGVSLAAQAATAGSVGTPSVSDLLVLRLGW